MRKKANYKIITINLGTLKTIRELHSELASVLTLPESYEHNWDSFWRMITEVIKMPDNLIFYNRWDFSKLFEEEADKLGSLIYKYNKLKKKDVILNDNLSWLNLGEEVKTVECIFEVRPSQFGLRGDIHLWDELERYFAQKGVPENEKVLIQQIYEAILSITGKSFDSGKGFFVEKFNTGGMSSGWVDDVFWIQKGIPLLIGRFKMLKQISRL